MSYKLTPRVGDRVTLVKGGVTMVGNVERIWLNGRQADVAIDGWGMSSGYPIELLTVVDRDPVEWPEGWRLGGAHIDRLAGWYDDDDATLWFSRRELERILATGPDMLARWDELVGGGE
jgi:hypothetical protein